MTWIIGGQLIGVAVGLPIVGPLVLILGLTNPLLGMVVGSTVTTGCMVLGMIFGARWAARVGSEDEGESAR